MKIRHGFVSNSSSSSYIITLPKMCFATDEALYLYMFGAMDYMNEFNDDESKPKWDSEDDVKIGWAKAMLAEHHIDIKSDANRYIIEGFSSMHNSYSDMPVVLKNLYFELKEDHEYISFKREGDN